MLTRSLMIQAGQLGLYFTPILIVFIPKTHLNFSKSQISHNKMKFGEGIGERIQEFKKINTPVNYF